jgi:hypothetical protein
MGNAGAKKVGLEKAYITVEESIAGMTKVVRFLQCEFHVFPPALSTGMENEPLDVLADLR